MGKKKSKPLWWPQLITCSECGLFLMPRSRRQKACGSRACKLARIKRLALARPETHRVPTMAARARERAMQRKLEESVFGLVPSVIDQCAFL